jgi:hypothetical protein
MWNSEGRSIIFNRKDAPVKQKKNLVSLGKQRSQISEDRKQRPETMVFRLQSSVLWPLDSFGVLSEAGG